MSRYKVDVDQMAERLKLSSWDTVDECNQEYYWDEARGADAGVEGEEAKADALADAESAARDDLFHKWHAGVTRAFEKLLDVHEMRLVPCRAKDEYPFEYFVLPKTTWAAAANALRETVNGVGHFHFSTLRAFLASGPYTARQAAIGHMHWMVDYPKVYGDLWPQRAYEEAFR